MPVYK
jgi:rSAM/selenodomain-associated transferase 2